MRKLGLLALAVVFVLGLGVSAHAMTLGMDFTSPTHDFTSGSWSLGWSFTVGSTSLSLQSLGFYSGSAGLSQDHDVGVFDSTGKLIASATVTPTDPLVSWWRWANVASPVVLAAGQTYTVAAETGRDNYTWDPTGLTWDPDIIFRGSRFVFANTLAFPTETSPGGVEGYFGPNIDPGPIPAPVPPSLLLLAPGLLGVMGFRRRFAG